MDARPLDPAEASRVKALHDLNILDTPREARFDRVVHLAQRVFDVPIAAVTLVDAERHWVKAEVGLGEGPDSPREDVFCHYTVQRPEALIVPDATADPRFRAMPAVAGDPHIRFYAGQPLRAPGGERIGSLCLMDTQPRALTAREQELLAEMAGWVERELPLHRQLDEAAQIQQLLMPRTTPDVAGYELAGRCHPTQQIGGDFFAWQLLDGGTLQIHVADVMGKGIPAALIAASVRAMLIGSSQAGELQETIDRAAAATEDLLSDTGAFVTLFSARLDPASGRVDYVDAGHGLGFVLSADGHRRLEPSGPPLGIMPGTTWAVNTTSLAPGETLVVVSDGFLDFFPTLEDSLAHAARAGLASGSAQELVDRAMAYADAQGHPDDTTVVALRRTPA